jgi:hypothetical protein
MAKQLTMPVEQLNSLEKLPLDEAKALAVSLLQHTKSPTRLLRLKHDVSKARNSREVMRIMWNTFMSGTGYGVPTSQWQSHYRSA